MNSKFKTPGPGHYKTERKNKIKGTYNYSGKGAFVAELEYRAIQTKGPGDYKVSLSQVEDKSLSPHINKTKHDRISKIVKNNSPSPVSYRVTEAMDKIRVDLNKVNHKWKKESEKRFIDIILSEKKKIPGVGQYETLDKAMDYQSKGNSIPVFRRRL